MVAEWAAEPVLVVDTSAEDRTSVAASVDTGSAGTSIATSPCAAASSAQALASSQRPEGRIGGTTVGTTVACHGGRRLHSVGANASADPLDVISLFRGFDLNGDDPRGQPLAAALARLLRRSQDGIQFVEHTDADDAVFPERGGSSATENQACGRDPGPTS
jgi:hypothetical protein